MKNNLFSFIVLFILVSLASSLFPLAGAFSSITVSANNFIPVSQEVSRPKYDYMSTILSRNTKQLGLKENKSLRKYLSQPSIKWAIRSEKGHILN